MNRSTVLFLLASAFLSRAFDASAQTNFFQNNSYGEWVMERYQIKAGSVETPWFNNIRPLPRSFSHQFISTHKNLFTSGSDRYNFGYLSNENLPYSALNKDQTYNDSLLYNSKKPLFKHFYRSRANFLQVNQPHLQLFVNPVLEFYGGYEKEVNDDYLFGNSRGVEIRGIIDDKVSFYSLIRENQYRFPRYIDRYTGKEKVIPGTGYWKPFKKGGYDFLEAQGNITFNATEHILFQLGHGRNFFGRGKRSLLLSDFSPNYLYLKINTRIWRFNYQNIFAELINGDELTTVPYGKKYGAFHILSLNILKNLRFSVFEGTIISDRNNTGRGFDLNYLNPVIFYRAVDHNLNSADNVVMGADLNYLPFKSWEFYGQFVIDEFLLKNFRDNHGHWTNKYGVQAGVKAVDIFKISNLDLRLEFNSIRPYTFSHRTEAINYSHFHQPLAHPLGSNFRELIGEITYQPTGRLIFELTGMLAQKGLDTGTTNWGGDINLPYNTRQQDENNKTGQGIGTEILYLRFRSSYQLKHNLFIDLRINSRTQKSEIPELTLNTNYVILGVRYNFFNQRTIF